MPQFHYKSHAPNKSIAFNYANNRMGMSDVHNNLLVKPIQFQEKEDNFKQKVHTAYARQRKRLHRIDLSNITSKDKAHATTHHSSFPNEIKDYISVPETEDADESRFEISKMGGTYGAIDNHTQMFRNKVIKDLSTSKLTKSSMNAVHKVRSNTAEANSGVRKPCQRFLARGNNPVAPPYEEHDIVPDIGNIPSTMFNNTFIDKDGNIRSALPGENRMSLTMQLVPFSTHDGKSDGAVLGAGPSSELLRDGASHAGVITAYREAQGANHPYQPAMAGMSTSNVNNFEEEISGVNLGKLFSVYGPSSK